MREIWTDEKGKRVLAIFPSTRGFGFAVLEGPLRLVDWGVKEVKMKKKNAMSMQKIEELIEFYRPEVIVIEDYTGEGSRRCRRIRRLIDGVIELAGEKNIPLRGYSRELIRDVFSGAGVKTKFEIAQLISEYFTELQPRLPRFRKPWMSEDSRMSIFDAVALALTFFSFEYQEEQEPQEFLERSLSPVRMHAALA